MRQTVVSAYLPLAPAFLGGGFFMPPLANGLPLAGGPSPPLPFGGNGGAPFPFAFIGGAGLPFGGAGFAFAAI